jgi:hypothetical protein
VLCQRLVETNVALLAHDLFQSFSDHEIGRQNRKLFVNVAGAQA